MPKKYEKPCRYCGLKMKLLQINDERAVYVCADKACKFYDFPEPVTKWTVKRSLEEFEKEFIEEMKRKKQQLHAKSTAKARIKELDQFVNDVYCEKFENSNCKFFINESEVNNKCSTNNNNNNGVDVDINKEKEVESNTHCDPVETTNQQVDQLLNDGFKRFGTENVVPFMHQIEVSNGCYNNNGENTDVNKEKKVEVESSNNWDSVKTMSEELINDLDQYLYISSQSKDVKVEAEWF